MRNKVKGFTLVELIIAMLFISILLIIGFNSVLYNRSSDDIKIIEQKEEVIQKKMTPIKSKKAAEKPSTKDGNSL